MVRFARHWVIRQLTLGEFSSRAAVWSKATWMAAKIALVAYGLNLLAHLLLVAFNLLPYPLGPALVIATVLTPPVSFLVALVAYAVVGLAIYDLRISRQKFELLSRTDMLSGLMNRRAFVEQFERMKGPVSMVLFDIDRFKAINDNFGHKAGDEVIAEVGEILRRIVPADGMAARLGGEEFAILIGSDGDASVMDIAEHVRLAVECRAFFGPGGHIPVTVSAGIAEAATGAGFSEMFCRADQAMYVAKAAGRNRIVHADQFLDRDTGLRRDFMSAPAVALLH